jgi:hypothetical protein
MNMCTTIRTARQFTNILMATSTSILIRTNIHTSIATLRAKRTMATSIRRRITAVTGTDIQSMRRSPMIIHTEQQEHGFPSAGTIGADDIPLA